MEAVDRTFATRAGSRAGAVGHVPARRARGDRRGRRSERVRQDDAARADLRAAGARPRTGVERSGGADAAARPAAAVARRHRQRRAGPAGPRSLPRRRRAATVRRGWRASGWPSSSTPGPRSSRAACASASRSCARCWPASRCWRSTSRSRRSTRSRARRCRAGSATCSREEPRTVVAGHPRRRGGGRARRPGGGACRRGLVVSVAELEVPLPRPRRRTDPAVVELRERALRGAGGGRMRSALNGWPALLLLLVLLGAWELYVDLGGADPLILPAPHAVASTLYTDRSLLWSNFLVTAEEVLLGIAGGRRRARFRDRHPSVPDPPTGGLSAARRVADAAGADHRARARAVAGVRDPAQAVRDRVGLLLLDRGHDARPASRRRSRPGEADAHLRRLSAADIPPRRAPLGAARRCSPGPRSPSPWP